MSTHRIAMASRLPRTTHRVGGLLVPLALAGCPGVDGPFVPPHASGFDSGDDVGDTDDPDTADGTASDGPIDPTNAGDDGNEPPPPEAELCDAGDEAWVKRAVPFIQGRKPESIREVRLLVSAIEQLDAQGMSGRRLVAQALAQGDLYLDRWRNYYYTQLRVHRRGDQRNPECYADLTALSLDAELADEIRQSRADDPPQYQNFTMADVVISSLRLDDITPAYSADLFARMGAPITGGNVTREEIEITNRAYYGKLFESQYLGRVTECLQCHTTGWSTTDAALENIDRHWPVYEGNYFELAAYGEFEMDDPLDEAAVHAIFRHAGFVDYSWCNENDPVCNPLTAVGVQAFGLDFNCGLFRTDAYEDPVVSLDDVSYWSGAFPEGSAANLFDLEPRFRAGLEALASSGVSADDMGYLEDPTVGMAFLFAMNQANEMWKEGMGYPLTVANRFPRNAAQRDTLAALTEAFFSSHYSVRTLVTEVATHPYFNQAPPDSCGASTPYPMAAVFDPFTKSATDAQEQGNGVGDMLHRHSAWVLLQSAMRSMWWNLPQQFGPSTTYAFLAPYLANTPEIVASVPTNLNPHFPAGSPGYYGLCGAGFGPPCTDAPYNYELMRDLGIYINPSEGGFNGIDFNGLLHWEAELASGIDPQLQGACTGPLDQGCAAVDYPQALVETALAQPGTLMWDVAVALKDRLIAEPEIANDSEIEAIEGIMAASLDETVADVGATETLAAARRYAGVLLNTPQFMLDGVVSTPQDPASDPVLEVPGTTSQELCAHFVTLAEQSASWSEVSASCSGGSLTVQ
ncbi:hypothetical protein [Paraliomyxa miuraensis]|uniref:hypothetical protein n=1 Tax=Paraliomyxa miuraensis TaxID=376150 RepID=UPI00224C83A2|nr:hypothetical protein [Paraliomyxa miuraensis]MCX4246963.1 hypothetical protein [Paraliomyxa miuraensis]